MNNYRFYVEAMTGDAIAKLEELNKLMDKIDSKSAKGTKDFFHTSQKSVDETIEEMQRVIQLKKELDESFEQDVSLFGSNGNIEGLVKAKENISSLQKEFTKTQQEFTKFSNMKASPNFINASTLRQQKAYRDELTETEQSLQRIKREMAEVNRLESRVKSRANTATATGTMTYTQANTFKKDLNSGSDLDQMRRSNAEKRSSLRSRYEQDNASLTSLREDTTLDRQIRKNRETALQERIKGTEKEIDALNKLDATIERVSETIGNAKNQVESAGVSVTPQKDTMKGTLASRAPSIAIASIGAFAGVFGGLYGKGKSASEQMREPSISIGQRTGQSDFRALRKELQMMGIDRSLGYKGADMLQFQEDVLGSSGFTNQEDLQNTTQAIAQGSRAVPVDKESLSEFMTQTMRSGSVSGADQVKAIQEAFLGAIEQSGMVGREKEQLEALKGISAQVMTGRKGSNDELNNLVAMQSVLAGTGNRALQGENGQQLMQDLDSGIRGVIDDPTMSLIFGRGTKYQGLTGRYELQKQIEKGISDPQNVETGFSYAEHMGQGNEQAEKAAFSQFTAQLGQRLTTDQIDGFYEARKNGGLSQENIDKTLRELGITGADKYQENADAYTDSKDATINASEAVTEKQATEVYENPVSDGFREVNSRLGKMNGILYGILAGVLASAGAGIASTLMGGGSSLLKGKLSGTFSAGGASTAGATATAGTSLLGEVGKSFTSGKATGGLKGGLSSAFGTAKDVASASTGSIKSAYASGGVSGALKEAKGVGSALFKSGTVDDVARGAGSVGASVAEGASKSTGFMAKAGGALGKVGKGLSKVAMPLAVGASLLDIATSDDKVKAVGENAGGWGGALAGGAIGASVGSVIPVVGTAIGGVAGSVIGGLAGTKVGGAVVDGARGLWNGAKDLGGKAWNGITNFFGGDVAEASELDSEGGAVGDKAMKKNEVSSKTQEEQTTANQKVLSEKNRADNNAKESDNLSLYSKLLDRASQILAQARSQNGIFGNGNGSGGSSGSDDEMGKSEGKDYDGKWADAIKDASKQMNENVTDAELEKILKLIQTESNGQEVIQNDWDVNAQNGNPSKGLLQYIQTTFDAYKVDGHGDINKGYDQILAFLNNTNWRQDLSAWEQRMANGQTGWGPTGSTKYAMGGKVNNPTRALIGEVPGQEEYVINPHQPTAPGLIAEVSQKARRKFSLQGDSESGNRGETNASNWAMRIANINAGGGASTSSNSNGQVLKNTNSVNVTVNVQGDASADKIARDTGDKVGARLLESASASVDFFAKEMKRI